MKRAAEAVQDESRRLRKPRTLLFGVTVLTSMDHSALNEVNVKLSPAKQVEQLALLAKKSGLDGVVCSGREIEIVRRACGKKFLIAVPGLRPAGSEKRDDQKRTLSISQAALLGADYFIVGRPVLEARDKVSAVKNLLMEVKRSE
mgnify:CR=1 FL=1